MVGLKDIAVACGLSVTQVSRALNNNNDVSEKTKIRVREVANQLGYVKNINARILATRDSNQLAVIINGIDNDENSEPSITYNIMKGINHYAREHNYEAVIYLNEKDDLSYESFCRQRGMKGVIIFGANYEDSSFQDLLRSNFPFVAVDNSVEGENKGCVTINNVYYAMVATEYLIKDGRTRIAMLSGHGHSLVEAERKSGYGAALAKHGLSMDPDLIINADFDTHKAYCVTKELFQRDAGVDGIFCASDFMALGALRALKEMGKIVPTEVSVFGFDGILLGQYSNPPLTTIKQNNFMKGYQAARMLHNIFEKRNQERTVVVPCEVVIRESTLS